MKLKTRLAIAILTVVTTFLLGTLINRSVNVFLEYRQQQSPWQVLLRFENQDLAVLDEQSTKDVKRASEQLTGKLADNKWSWFEPRLFRTITNTSGEKRYILVEEKPMTIIPGESKLRVHIFDTSGNLLDEEEFGVGLRISVTSLRIRKVYGVEGEALVVTGEFLFVEKAVFQAYNLIGNQLTRAELPPLFSK